jgi:integrase
MDRLSYFYRGVEPEMWEDWRPDLSNESVVLLLKPRRAAYFKILQYCRHIGIHICDDGTGYWVARVRRKDGAYTQQRLCLAFHGKVFEVNFEEALKRAEIWFASETVSKIAAEPYQLGSRLDINICPIGDIFTVGHALQDYLGWKLIAATKSHFSVLVSLINYHLVPRLAHLPLDQFDGNHFQKLAYDVLETPPKVGRVTPRHRNNLRLMSQEELRKRKKTFNALAGILRGAIRLARERGNLESERPLLCIHRLPNLDRARVVFLDRQECRRLVDSSHPDMKQLILAALYTGCRANELQAALVGDFSLSTKSLFIASPKGRRTRYVLLPDEALAFFQSLVEGRGASDRLFRKRNGRIWGSEYKSYFQKARTTAKLPNILTFHGLRHTYASQLIQSGASLLTIADQFGHVDTQTVTSTYGHLTIKGRLEDVNQHFASILPEKGKLTATIATTDPGNFDESSLPMFRHQDSTSWPRSNHSRFSGPVLKDIKPE